MSVKRTVPLQIIFRNLDPSGPVEIKIQERLAKLETYCDRIASCRVTVEALQGGDQFSMRYRIGMVVQVLGRELVVECESDGHFGGAYIYVPIHDAFDAIRRQILQLMSDRATDVHSGWGSVMHDDLPVEEAEFSGL